jgi:hypothetical protein
VNGARAQRATRRSESERDRFKRQADATIPPRVAGAQALPLWPISALAANIAAPASDPPPEACLLLAHWVRAYLMRPHADLGRAGDVCPFTAQASRLDAIRIGVSDADAGQAASILDTMEGAIAAFEDIPCAASMRHFRTVIVGFPCCAGAEGLRVLKQTQNRLRPHSIFRGKMIGCFEPNSVDRGLINPDFRPLRAPIPLLAIRLLVENDAPFVLRNPLLAPIYLANFKIQGARRLLAALRR